jgi:hypothetical protein
MKPTPLALAVASVLAASATAASAQTYGQAYSAYQAAQNSYYNQQSAYQASRETYDQARARYEADRAAYDARWGYGAYARAYGPFAYTAPAPTYGYGYGTTPYSSYPATTYPAAPYSSYPYTPAPSAYGYGYGTSPYYAGAYGANSAYTTAVPCSNTSGSANISVLAALAQAALGGGVSASTAINQAVLGAVVDNSVGRQSTYTARCDSRGYYYTRAQTQPYREGYYDSYGRWHATAPSPQYASCRIAPAPTDAYAQTYQYVRVCPDSSGRYRITG